MPDESGLLSRENERLIRSLHRREGRETAEAFLVEGERELRELAHSNFSPRLLFAQKERHAALQSLFPEIAVHFVRGDGAQLFATRHTQGVGAVVAKPAEASLH